MLNFWRVLAGAAFVVGCGSTQGSTPSSGGAAGAPTAGASGNANSGSGGVSTAGGASTSGGTANHAGNAGNAGNGAVGSVDIELPAGAVEIGPYGFSGNRAGVGTNWLYTMTLGPGGHALFGVTGTLMLGEQMPVKTGLLRAPDSALGKDWHCPGAATWVPTTTSDTADCKRSSCEYVMIMPTPTRLACGAAGSGTLSVAPAAPGEQAAATSSLAEYNGVAMLLASAAVLGLDPQQSFAPSSIDFISGEAPQTTSTQVFFDASPVPAAAGAPVTEWTLSSPYVVRRSGLIGETTLYCATSGTYRISSTEPIKHSLELSGLTGELHCPGAPLPQPVVLHMD